MRLTIPEPKIELYKDGFAEHDKLKRKDTGDRLSDLAERIDDSLVLALDGAWGSGKSHFLKCWVGEHLKRNDCTTQTVYFDALQHDFLDDPLIALTSAISERIERQPQSKAARAWQTAKMRPLFLAKLLCPSVQQH
jgi:KAP family P-loop domain